VLSTALGSDDDPLTPPDRDTPHLEGLVEGINHVRSDEGRHVGFGMQQVQVHLVSGFDEQVVQETLHDLMPFVAETVSVGDGVIAPMPLVKYAREKLTRRIDIITDADADVPGVEEFVALEDGAAAD